MWCARTWAARAACGLLGLLAPIVVLDCGLRTAGPSLSERFTFPGQFATPHRYLESHPIYGLFHIPNVICWMWSEEFVTEIKINARGLRERDVGYERTPGVRRILVLGDSFVEAQQVAEDERLTRHLERLLEADGGRAVEVVNAGVTGFATGQELLFLEHELYRYRPDAIVLVFYLENDVSGNSQRIRGGAHLPYFTVTDGGELRALPFSFHPRFDAGPLDWVYRESMVLSRAHRELRDRWRALRLAESSDEDTLDRVRLDMYADRTDERWDEAWRITEALLEAVAREVADTPLLLVSAPASFEIYPDDWQRIRDRYWLPSDGWDLAQPGRRLAEIAARVRVPFLDVRTHLAEAAGAGPRLYFRNNRHWTAAGHAVVARAVAAALPR